MAKNKKLLKQFNSVGENVFISKGHRIRGAKWITLGNDFYAGPDCRIEAWDSFEGESFSPLLVFGNGVKVNSRCHIGCINRIEMGDNCLLGSYVFITDHSHGNPDSADIHLHPVKRPLFSKGPVIIENDCWLCEYCVVLPNVRIGHHSIIGASAVVTHDVPPYSIVVGNPARIIPINSSFRE